VACLSAAARLQRPQAGVQVRLLPPDRVRPHGRQNAPDRTASMGTTMAIEVSVQMTTHAGFIVYAREL
jgi:hypothetical protein